MWHPQPRLLLLPRIGESQPCARLHHEEENGGHRRPGGEHMPTMAWVPGLRPLDYAPAAVNEVIQLFKDETGERYAEASVRHLPIPVWDGNLILVDLDEQEPRTIQGVFYGTPFMDDIARVAAFVVASEHQGQGWGNEAWNRFNNEAWRKGFRRVQLEVKASNEGAQRFYQRRGLHIEQELNGYYQSGLGYMMRGPLSSPHD